MAAQAAMETDGTTLLKYLTVFREFDASGDGFISATELYQALEKSGLQLTQREFRKFLAEVDTDGNEQIDFKEFCELAKQLAATQSKYKAKSTRVPRAYLTPDMFEQYKAYFISVAGDDGQINVDELQQFFKLNRMTVTTERLKAIMQEVDDDASGYLDEGEFMVLLIKATGLKKRKVGPGLCSVDMLRDEGWSLLDMRRLGYECKDFTDAGYTVKNLIDVFSAAEFRKVGVTLKELLDAGWDGLKAREAGFELKELVDAGCGIRRMRASGWDDPPSAALMREFGLDAARMKLGGWALSELKIAGYSTMDLRLAGFSAAGIAAHEMVMSNTRPTERKNTFRLREDMLDVLHHQGRLVK